MTAAQNEDSMVVSYTDLIEDPQDTFERVMKFAALMPGKTIDDEIKRVAAAQKQYRPKHCNLPLSSFGLSEERIGADLGPARRTIERVLAASHGTQRDERQWGVSA